MKKVFTSFLLFIIAVFFPIQTFGQDNFAKRLLDHLKNSVRVSVRLPGTPTASASGQGGGIFFPQRHILISNDLREQCFLRIFISCSVNKKTGNAQEVCWLGPGDSVFVMLPRFNLQTDIQIPISVLVYDCAPNFQTDGIVPQDNSFIGSTTRVISFNTRDRQNYQFPVSGFQKAYKFSKNNKSKQLFEWTSSSYTEKFPGRFGTGGRHIVHIINNTLDYQITLLDSIAGKTVTINPGQLYPVEYGNYGTRSSVETIRVSFFKRQRQRTPSSNRFVFDSARNYQFTLNAYGIHGTCFIPTP
jgi:hypothetical protein